MNAALRTEKFLAERARMRVIHPEQIAGLHEGHEREALLTVSDLRELLDDVARLRAELENERAHSETAREQVQRMREILDDVDDASAEKGALLRGIREALSVSGAMKNG